MHGIYLIDNTMHNLFVYIYIYNIRILTNTLVNTHVNFNYYCLQADVTKIIWQAHSPVFEFSVAVVCVCAYVWCGVLWCQKSIYIYIYIYLFFICTEILSIVFLAYRCATTYKRDKCIT